MATRIEAAAKALYEHNAIDNEGGPVPDYPADEFFCCAEAALAASDAILLSDATVERATRKYEEHWGIGHFDRWECACGEFVAEGSDGVAQGAVHRHIVRAVLAAALKEDQ